MPGAPVVPGTWAELAMVYSRNGRTIKIPVQNIGRQLPAAGQESPPPLMGPHHVPDKAVETEPEVGDADWQAQVFELQSEVEHWKAQAFQLRTALEDWKRQASGSQAEVESWKAQVSDLRGEVGSWKAQLARLQAREAEVRRRAEHQVELQVREERERLLTRLLTVADNLERALSHADENDPLYAGVRLTLDDLLGQLAKEAVEPIRALGKPFDPNFHEAVATDGSGGATVVRVLRTGYTLNGELLRPARVVVGRLKAPKS